MKKQHWDMLQKISENAEFANVEDISSHSLSDVLMAIMASRLH